MGTAAQKTSAMDVRGALKEAIHRLRDAHVPSHTLAAELLLMHVLGRERAWLYAHPEEMVGQAAAQKYFELVARRAAGEPTQYLTGRQEFWGLEFEVTPDVLIPRPETEHVIEVALERIAGRSASPQISDGAGLRIADVGTGSGCIAVALARELPAAQVFATDISAAALAVAQCNAARHGVASRIHFILGNLLDALEGGALPPLSGGAGAFPLPQDARLDLVVSNPPYVGRSEKEVLPREVREHEPEQALFAGERGLEIYAPLIAQAEKLLGPGGMLVLELGYGAAKAVYALLDQLTWTRVNITNDLAGIPRVIAAQRA